MQKCLLIGVIVALFISCKSDPRYGKDTVQLDNFDFGLNIDTFFEDESYFRVESDNYMLSSEEKSLDDTTFTYFRYEGHSSKSEKPLAEYKGIAFNRLNLLTDSTDQQVLLINAFKRDATTQEIKKLIDDLLDIDPKPVILNAFMSGTSIVFRAKDRVLSVYLNVRVDAEEKDYSDYDPYKQYTDEELEEMTKNYLTQHSYRALLQKIEEKGDNLELSLFIADPTFDQIYNLKSRGSSGFMTEYRTKD